jgi:hypothetical protein
MRETYDDSYHWQWREPGESDGNAAGRRVEAPVQWPLKLMRISSLSPFFHRAKLVFAADCAAYSYAAFREAFGGEGTLVIGCPDAFGERLYYKLAEVLALNDILGVTLVRMDTACCNRTRAAVMAAIRASRKDIPLNIVTLFTEGETVD